MLIFRLLNWLRQIQNSKTPEIIPDDIKKDLKWWYFFLPQLNGISMMDMEEWSEPNEIVASDACFSGVGAFSQGNIFSFKFPEFIYRQNLHNNALELLFLYSLKIMSIPTLI